MTQDEMTKTICAALGGIEASQIEWSTDTDSGLPLAKVALRDDQLDRAFRENGRYIREAAMTLGVEIEL